MQVRCSEFAFKLFYVFKADPGRNQKVVLCLWNQIDVFDSAVIAKDCVRSKSKLAYKIFQLTKVSQPEKILIRNVCPDVYKSFDFWSVFAGHAFNFWKILIDDCIYNLLVPPVVVAFEARSICVNYRLISICKLTYNFARVITNDFRNTACKNHVQICINNLEGVFDCALKLFGTAKDYVLFVDTCTRKDVRRKISRASCSV